MDELTDRQTDRQTDGQDAYCGPLGRPHSKQLKLNQRWWTLLFSRWMKPVFSRHQEPPASSSTATQLPRYSCSSPAAVTLSYRLPVRSICHRVTLSSTASSTRTTVSACYITELENPGFWKFFRF